MLRVIPEPFLTRSGILLLGLVSGYGRVPNNMEAILKSKLTWNLERKSVPNILGKTSCGAMNAL